MKRLITICLAVTMILAISGAANADWNPGDPAKWVQLPDLQPTGIDVLATHPKVLADDFLCIQTGPITDIHIWGSWLQDYLPVNSQGLPDASLVNFRLSIHSDIPKGPTGGYSRPGDLLWEKVFNPGDFVAKPYAGDLQEGWYNPNTGEYIRLGDTQVWQYNFFIDPALAFLQQGTTANPITYWLDVEASPVSVPGVAEPLFGWKTSYQHWNDDAVWGDSPTSPWQELVYPQGHPFAGQSMDLAFAITPEPATMALLGLGSLVLLRRRKA
jgi:hypothetical protein